MYRLYQPIIALLPLGLVWLSLLLQCQPVEAAKTLDVSLEKGQLLLTPRHGGDGSGWGKEECVACHFLNSIHKEAPIIREIVDSKGFTTCTGCHGQNGTQAVRQCGICHNAKDLPDSPLLQGQHSHDFSVKEVNALNDGNCLVCHVSSDMDGTFEPDIDLTLPKEAQQLEIPFQNVSEFCVRCHNQNHQQPGFPMQARFPRDPLVTMDENYDLIDFHGKPKGTGQRTYAGLREGDYRYGTLVDCTDCHAMHGTHNPKLILDRSDVGATLLADHLRFQPIQIDIDGGDYSQLCVVCHAMETIVEDGAVDTGNGFSGVHEVGTDCTACHTHGNAVQTGL